MTTDPMQLEWLRQQAMGAPNAGPQLPLDPNAPYPGGLPRRSRIGRVFGAGERAINYVGDAASAAGGAIAGAADALNPLGSNVMGRYLTEDPDTGPMPAIEHPLAPQAPAPAPTVGPAPMSMADGGGDPAYVWKSPSARDAFRSGNAIDVPSISRDPHTGVLSSSGAVPRLSADQIPDSVGGGAYQPGPDWGTPDVSLAGMANDRRARGAIEDNYQAQNAAIDYPEDYASERNARLQKAYAAAADPTGIKDFSQRAAITADIGLDRQSQEQARATAYLRNVDAQIDAEVEQHLQALQAQGLNPIEFKAQADDIQAKANAAKARIRQDYAIAAGKVTTSFQPDKSAFSG